MLQELTIRIALKQAVTYIFVVVGTLIWAFVNVVYNILLFIVIHPAQAAPMKLVDTIFTMILLAIVGA